MATRTTYEGVCVTLVFMLLVTGPAGAEVIFLRNGRVVYGRIIDQSRKTVRIRRSDGSVKSISKRRIRRIDFNAKRPSANRPAANRPARRKPLRKSPVREAPVQRHSAGKVVHAPSSTTQGEDIPWTLVARSALLPGWGQWTRNDKTAAAGFGAAFGLLAATALNFRARYRAEAASLRNLNNPYAFTAAFAPETALLSHAGNAAIYLSIFRDQRTRLSNRFRLSRRANLALVLMYLTNLAHAAWFSSSSTTVPVFSATTQTRFSFVDSREENRLIMAIGFSY